MFFAFRNTASSLWQMDACSSNLPALRLGYAVAVARGILISLPL